jgi:D-tyrosyl-tRNA(Tyr) deacylase
MSIGLLIKYLLYFTDRSHRSSLVLFSSSNSATVVRFPVGSQKHICFHPHGKEKSSQRYPSLVGSIQATRYIAPPETVRNERVRVLLQRTTGCEVHVDGRRISKTGPGLLLLIGCRSGDTEEIANWLADKVVNLRIFEDDDGKLNRSAFDVGAEVMVVSQFTLYADCRKGRRPGFSDAMAPDSAEQLYERFAEMIEAHDLTVGRGEFGAKMDIQLTNHGPVTILLEYDG